MTWQAAEKPASALRSLVAVADSAAPVPVGGVAVAPDGHIGIIEPPGDLNLGFSADGIPYRLTLASTPGGRLCRITADIGFVPYSAQGRNRRQAILLALDAAKTLPTVRFHLTHGQAIRVEAETMITERVTSSRLFLEVMRLLQEARPFVRLIGEYL